ncbi:ornithine cyclodeaminase [Halobacteriales archaeon QS_1_68_17]|nr:MAG: ornithine cyclodeaminase [Halobacteriales archaeon QS_1_68_17]
MTRLYSRDDVRDHIDFSTTLEVVEQTYVETANDRVLNPPKLSMHLGDDREWPDLNAFAIDMPAYVDWLDVAGVKWAIATWDAERDVPISSLILLFDPIGAEFTAVMEGMYLTGVRTAMQSVVGLKHLHSDDIGTIGVFGAGFQAEFQLRVIDHLLDVEVFDVFDVDSTRARDLVSRLEPELDASISAATSRTEALGGDVIITVTDSKTPVLEDSETDGSEFIIALGSYRELPDRTILDADRIVVDHVEQCLQRGALADLASRGQFTEEDIDSTIGTVLVEDGQAVVSEGERVVFVPIGLGSLDISIAEHIRRETAGRQSLSEYDFV